MVTQRPLTVSHLSSPSAAASSSARATCAEPVKFLQEVQAIELVPLLDVGVGAGTEPACLMMRVPLMGRTLLCRPVPMLVNVIGIELRLGSCGELEEQPEVRGTGLVQAEREAGLERSLIDELASVVADVVADAVCRSELISHGGVGDVEDLTGRRALDELDCHRDEVGVGTCGGDMFEVARPMTTEPSLEFGGARPVFIVGVAEGVANEPSEVECRRGDDHIYDPLTREEEVLLNLGQNLLAKVRQRGPT